MKMTATVLALAALVAVGCSPAARQTSIVGVWSVVGSEALGFPLPPPTYQGMEVTFADGKMTTTKPGEAPQVATYRLNDATQPRSIDLVELQGSGKTQQGIYQLQGDDLKLCLAGVLPGRPANFKTTKENYWSVLILKRKQ